MAGIRAAAIMALVMAVTAGWAGPASADCADPQTTAEMRDCAAKDLRTADGALNKAYRMLMDRMDEEGSDLLKTSQRSWIAFRDDECAFQGHWTDGGSIQPQIVTQCMTTLTEARVQQLQTYLDCEEGDLTCPPK